jgi:hypothetical protein
MCIRCDVSLTKAALLDRYERLTTSLHHVYDGLAITLTQALSETCLSAAASTMLSHQTVCF